MVKNLPANAGHTEDVYLVPGLGRSLREGNGNSLPFSYLGNPMDKRTWQATVHGVTKSQTPLNGWACSILSKKNMYLLNVSYVLSIAIYLGAKQWCERECVSHLVVSDSLWSHGQQLTRLFCPWNSPGKNTGVDSYSYLQGILPT